MSLSLSILVGEEPMQTRCYFSKAFFFVRKPKLADISHAYLVSISKSWVISPSKKLPSCNTKLVTALQLFFTMKQKFKCSAIPNIRLHGNVHQEYTLCQRENLPKAFSTSNFQALTQTARIPRFFGINCGNLFSRMRLIEQVLTAFCSIIYFDTISVDIFLYYIGKRL